jgi:hypothetical protein
VLLLAATAMKESCSSANARTASREGDECDASEEPELKKRKQAAAGIMRKKSSPDAMSLASHVSPCSRTPTTESDGQHRNPDGGSGSSIHGSGANGTTGRHEGSQQPAPGSSPSSSYDLKDGQALHDSAKIHDPKDIALMPSPPPSAAARYPHRHPHEGVPTTTTTTIPSQKQNNHHQQQYREIPHFPSVLHAVLTESEFAGKVLLWLPHGQAWRIVRWDALRRQVLPKYFTQLNEDMSKEAAAGASAAQAPASPSGSIDAFLWHLSAWGFEEVNEGPDVGAYTHVVREQSKTLSSWRLLRKRARLTSHRLVSTSPSEDRTSSTP